MGSQAARASLPSYTRKAHNRLKPANNSSRGYTPQFRWTAAKRGESLSTVLGHDRKLRSGDVCYSRCCPDDLHSGILAAERSDDLLEGDRIIR